MTAYRLPADAVVLTGTALVAARFAVQVAQVARRRDGLPASTALADLEAALSMSPAGHADTPRELVGEADYMTTDEAADQLGCTERHARRLAPLLGGRLVGGRWLVDRVAVVEHIEGSTHP